MFYVILVTKPKLKSTQFDDKLGEYITSSLNDMFDIKLHQMTYHTHLLIIKADLYTECNIGVPTQVYYL